MGVASQHIALLLPEQVGPGLSLMSPAQRSSNRRCRARFATLETDKLPEGVDRVLGDVEALPECEEKITPHSRCAALGRVGIF